MILPSRLSHFPLNKGHEGIPIPVHLDASKLKACLCPFLDPTHASVVQALADHMLDRPLDRAGGQLQILRPKPVILHAIDPVEEVVPDILKPFPSGLVSPTAAWNVLEGSSDLPNHFDRLALV